MQRLLRAGRVRLGVLVRRLCSEFIAALRLPLGRGVGGRLDLEATGAAEPGDQALEPHCNNGEALDQPQATDLGETSDDVPATLPCAPPQLGSVSLADARFETGRPAAAPESTVGGQTTCIVCFTNPKSHSAVPCAPVRMWALLCQDGTLSIHSWWVAAAALLLAAAAATERSVPPLILGCQNSFVRLCVPVRASLRPCRANK